MSALPRPVSLLLLLAVPGAAGWFGGKWAHEGLLPAPRSPVRLVPQAAPAVREPKVEPSSPEGKWMARACAAAPGDFAALLDDLDTTFPKATAAESHHATRQWLLALWIARDADAAAAWVVERKDKALGADFGALLGSVAPAKVAALINSPLCAALGPNFLDSALRALAETDPQEFLKVDAAAAGDAFTSHYARAMRVLAVSDPAAASEIWLRRGAQAPGGKDALYNIVGNWIARDPQAARRWVDALPDPEARRLAQHAWLGALAKKDVAAARRELANMDLGVWLPGRPGGMEQPELQYPQDARMIVLAALAQQDFRAALAELDNMVRLTGWGGGFDVNVARSDSPSNILRDALAAAAVSLPDEPAALLAQFRNLTDSDGQPLDPALSAELRRVIVEKKMTGWNAATSLEALRLLEAGDTSGDREAARARVTLTHQLMRQAMTTDPDGSLAFIAAQPEAERGSMARIAVGIHDGQNLPALLNTAAMIPPELWDTSLGSRFAQWPEDAAPLMSRLPDAASTGAARAAFTKSWADKDPEAAAEWVAALPQGAAPAARGLTEAWAAYDDTASSVWTASLPPGHARDGAALGLASSIAAAEPEAAWHWAASISDAALSANAFVNVARLWGREAPEDFRAAFSTALDRSGSTGEPKDNALRALEQPRQLTQPPTSP